MTVYKAPPSINRPVVIRMPEVRSKKVTVKMGRSESYPEHRVRRTLPSASMIREAMESELTQFNSKVGGQPTCPAPPEYLIPSVNTGLSIAVAT